MKNIFAIVLLLTATVGFAQKKKKQDAEAIKSMCGCYEVTFSFAETFAANKDYEFHDNYQSGGLEWVQLVEDTKDKVSMQHLLIVGNGVIVKHWRQDWLYQNTDFYMYDKDKSWKYVSLPTSEVKGQWTQKVYQVDDGLRYEGSASWIHADGRHFWENTTDAPLPRREYSKRSDYNVMIRTNRHEITDDGWLHEQDNDKVIRAGDEDVLLAKEKGWNTYKKVADSRCKAAQDWWKENQAYWADVRTVWDGLFASKEPLSFSGKVGGKALYERLFSLGKEVTTTTYDSKATQQKIKEAIETHKK